MKKVFFLFLIISTLTLFTAGESLKYALNGDDWLALYRYITTFTSFGSHFDIKNYSTNYDIANIIMGIVWRFFGFTPFPYYLLSLLLRISTSISLFPVVYSFTKSKGASVLSAILFSIMYAGIETTNWVFNMNTYLSILLLNLFSYCYFKLKTYTPKTLIPLSILILFIFLTAPTRMHGIIFFVPLIVFICSRKLTISRIKNLIIATLLLLGPLIIFRIYITSFGNISNHIVRSASFDYFINVVTNLIINLGYAALPDEFFSMSIANLHKNGFYFLIGILVLLTGFFFIRSTKTKDNLGKLGLLSLLSSISFLIVPGLINPQSFFSSNHRYLLISGNFLIISFACLINIFYKKGNLIKTTGIAIAIFLIIANILSLKLYFNNLSKNGRLAEDVDRVFEHLAKIKPKIGNIPAVFLFFSNNNSFLYNTLTFGFTTRMIYLNPYIENNIQTAPFAVDNFESLKSIISDKNSPELKRYGYKPYKIPLENVYSFYIDQERITDYSKNVRESLKQALPLNLHDDENR